MSKLSVISTVTEIQALKTLLCDAEFVAFDTETTGLTPQDRVVGFSVCADESAAHYVVLEKWNPSAQALESSDNLVEATDLIQSLISKKLIMHNATFDCMIVEAYFKIRLINSVFVDTMILAHLLDENRRVGLKELAKSMYGINAADEAEEMKASVSHNGGKLTAKTYEMYKADSQILGKYGAKDALLTYKLFLDMVPELYDQGLEKFFFDDESMPLLKGSTYELNTVGLKVNTVALTTLKKTLEAECAEAKTFIYREIAEYIKQQYPGPKKFNIGSSKQLSWLLFEKLGLEFNALTKTGRLACRALGIQKLPYTFAAKRAFIAECARREGEIYALSGTHNGNKVPAKKIKPPWDYIQCDKKTLVKLAPKYKWIERLLEYQRKTKLLSTYVKGLEERIQYGIIRPSFLQHGTSSGRYSSRNPNFQNLPRDDKRIKACIVARPGKIFVGADYSQLEPRVFAYFSGDKRLCEAFRGADDFYSIIGMEVYGVYDCTPRKEGSPDAFGIKYKKLRDLSKTIALASTYGATAYQLASTTGKTPEATQEDIDSYFERFPGVRQYQLDMHLKAKREGCVFNLFGRPRRIPQALHIPEGLAHGELPYDARNTLNLAVNHPIQSTSASIVNRAAILFNSRCNQANIDCRLVLQVHDSLVAECAEGEADTVALLLQDSMETAVELKGVKLEAVPKIGKTLAEV